MKRYAYIQIIHLCTAVLCSMLLFSSCRSNRILAESKVLQETKDTTEQTTESEQSNSTTSTTMDQTTVEDTASSEQTESSNQKEAATDEYKEKDTAIDIYDKEGNIRATIRTNERSGRMDRVSESGRSLHASSGSGSSHGQTRVETETEVDTNKQTDSNKESNTATNINEQIDLSEKSDSRWIQGWEWLAVILPIAIVCGIIYLIRNGRKKNNTGIGS